MASPILQREADMAFLALVLWREARGETHEGKTAVAWSIMNRMAARQWGNTLMSVIFQRLQYSSVTYKGDPQLTLWPKDDDQSWQTCLRVADETLEGLTTNPIDGADSYHDVSIDPPDWARKSVFVKQIGRIKFYKVGT
jgi:N-acetylmuramoyl-L-alanine amidase